MANHSGHSMGQMGANARALKISAWLTGIYFLIELAIGIHTGSVAVISDAFHTFSAVGGVVLAIVAARIARRPADEQRTFGSLRAEFGFHLSTLQIETTCLDEDHAKELDFLNVQALAEE